jgi:hypothetical protein
MNAAVKLISFRKVLVVGGMKKFVYDVIAPKLEKYGLAVAWHWPMDHDMAGTVPAACEGIIMFPEMTPGATSVRKHLQSHTKKMGIPLVATARKSSVFNADLQAAGFQAVNLDNPNLVVAPTSTPPPPVVFSVPGSVQAPVAKPVIVPAWLSKALATQLPIELNPEKEAELFAISTDQTFTLTCTVTPEIAGRWIDVYAGRNKRNRRLKQRKVDKLAREFGRGEYVKTHEGLAFGRDGSLQDGQHRLWAIFLSGVTVEILVTFGQVEEARKVLNTGTSRKPWENRTVLTGDSNSKSLLEIATVISYLVTRDTSNVPSLDEGEGFIQMFKDGVEWAATLTKKKIFGTASVRGALAFAYRTNPEKVTAFADQVIDGLLIDKGDPAYTLRCYLERARPYSSKDRREVAVKTLRALLYFLSNEKMDKIYAAEDAVSYFAKAHKLELKGSGYRIPKPEDPTAGEGK